MNLRMLRHEVGHGMAAILCGAHAVRIHRVDADTLECVPLWHHPADADDLAIARSIAAGLLVDGPPHLIDVSADRAAMRRYSPDVQQAAHLWVARHVRPLLDDVTDEELEPMLETLLRGEAIHLGRELHS